MHFGDDGQLLSAAVASEGGALEAWQVDHVHRQPGGATTVGYRAVARRGRSRVEEYLCVSDARLSAQAASRTDHVVLSDGERRVTVWRRPCDPELPALARAMLPHQGGTVSLHSYRPLRRAVLVARNSQGVESYRKVVRPDRVAALHARLEVCATAGLPVPRVLRFDTDGLLELAQVPGRSLLAVLAEGRGFELGAVLDLLERLPAPLMAQRQRPAWSTRAMAYVELAVERFPQLGAQIEAIAHTADERVQAAPDGPLVPTHGDLYEAQLYVSGDAVSGLIDLDTAGPGHRADDLACLLGHLAALPHFDARFTHVAGRMPQWFAQASGYVGAVGLGPRVAAVLITLLGTTDVGHASDLTQRNRAAGLLAEAQRYLAA